MSHEELERASKPDFKGFQEAARLMMKKKPGPRYIGRWDWHLWMFLIGCLPSVGIYCVALWVRSDIKKKEQVLELERIYKEKELEKKAKMPSLSDRIQSLENKISTLQIQLLLSKNFNIKDLVKPIKKEPQNKKIEEEEIIKKEEIVKKKEEKFKPNIFQRFWIRSETSMNMAHEEKPVTDFDEIIGMQEEYNRRLERVNRILRERNPGFIDRVKNFFEFKKESE